MPLQLAAYPTGTKKRKYPEDNAGALAVTLIPTDLAAIEAVLAQHPNPGRRRNEDALNFVNQ